MSILQILGSNKTATEKAEAFVLGAATGKMASGVISTLAGEELAELLGGPAGFLIGLCGDSPRSCEEWARAEAQEKMIGEIKDRAWQIMRQGWAAKENPDMRFALEIAIHEKSTQLGLDEPRESCDPARKCCVLPPMTGFPGPAPPASAPFPRMNPR